MQCLSDKFLLWYFHSPWELNFASFSPTRICWDMCCGLVVVHGGQLWHQRWCLTCLMVVFAWAFAMRPEIITASYSDDRLVVKSFVRIILASLTQRKQLQTVFQVEKDFAQDDVKPTSAFDTTRQSMNGDHIVVCCTRNYCIDVWDACFFSFPLQFSFWLLDSVQTRELWHIEISATV